MLLLADIGGTKTQLALAASPADSLTKMITYQNSDFDGFEDVLSSYLGNRKTSALEKCVLAIAGPVHHNNCVMTNLPWTINGDDIANRFKISEVKLINDLAATAYAIPQLQHHDFLVLQQSTPILENGPIAVISIGTGLGECALLWDKTSRHYRSVSGEGGHRDFAPHDSREVNLLSHLFNALKDQHIGTEKLLSGHGMQEIYKFLSQTEQTDSQNSVLTPSDIVELASRQNSLCEKTLLLFSDLIATEAANIALQYMSGGGVMIAGGIPPRLSSYLASPRFLDRFRDKGKFSDWLSNIPLSLCTNIHAPLIGARYYAFL